MQQAECNGYRVKKAKKLVGEPATGHQIDQIATGGMLWAACNGQKQEWEECIRQNATGKE